MAGSEEPSSVEARETSFTAMQIGQTELTSLNRVANLVNHRTSPSINSLRLSITAYIIYYYNKTN